MVHLPRYDVGPLEERSKYGPGPVQVSYKQAQPIPLWMRFAFHAQQLKCTCSSRFLQWPNLSINTLWPKLTCFSNLFLNILTFWRAFVLNNKMPFYKHCSNFRDLVNYPVPCKRSGCLNTFGPPSCERLGTDPIRSKVDRSQIYPVQCKRGLKEGNGELSLKNKEFWRELICIVAQIVNEPVNSLQH